MKGERKLIWNHILNTAIKAKYLLSNFFPPKQKMNFPDIYRKIIRATRSDLYHLIPVMENEK